MLFLTPRELEGLQLRNVTSWRRLSTALRKVYCTGFSLAESAMRHTFILCFLDLYFPCNR